jgi:riboflavin synthase
MFTGIIEHLGTISRLETGSAGGRLTVHAPSLECEPAVSSSIAVNGCCLTAVESGSQHFSADLSPETLAKTSFAALKPGARVNLEQPLRAGKEFGGHFVLGHVDSAGSVSHLKPDGDSWLLGIRIPSELAGYIVTKGSLTVDGISLTVAGWHDSIAEIAVIPYTFQHTNIRDRAPGDLVNLEADILGKYVERYLRGRQSSVPASPLRIPDLVRQGF